MKKINKKIGVCSNHLTLLFEALQSANFQHIKTIEHELTEEEKCVACTYVLRTQGSVKEALLQFLKEEGFAMEEEKNDSKTGRTVYWVMRICMYFVIFAAMFFVEIFVKNIFLTKKTAYIFSPHVFEVILVGVISLFAFILIDDMFFD